jgi:hypothetical protein
MKNKIVLGILIMFIASAGFSQEIEKKYPFQMGNMRFSKSYSVFSNLKNTEVQTDTIYIINQGAEELIMEFKDINHLAHLSYQILPSSLAPGKEGLIIIRVDGAKVPSFGFANVSLGLYTNDTQQSVKRITLSLNLVEDFSKLTPKQLANAPKASFSETTYNFGTVSSGTNVKHSFVVKNTGKSELVIRKTTASCGCTATHPVKSNLQPEESTTIDINFNTSGRSGRQVKTVTVITNDPANPSVTLIIEGTLE